MAGPTHKVGSLEVDVTADTSGLQKGIRDIKQMRAQIKRDLNVDVGRGGKQGVTSEVRSFDLIRQMMQSFDADTQALQEAFNRATPRLVKAQQDYRQALKQPNYNAEAEKQRYDRERQSVRFLTDQIKYRIKVQNELNAALRDTAKRNREIRQLGGVAADVRANTRGLTRYVHTLTDTSRAAGSTGISRPIQMDLVHPPGIYLHGIIDAITAELTEKQREYTRALKSLSEAETDYKKKIESPGAVKAGRESKARYDKERQAVRYLTNDIKALIRVRGQLGAAYLQGIPTGTLSRDYLTGLQERDYVPEIDPGMRFTHDKSRGRYKGARESSRERQEYLRRDMLGQNLDKWGVRTRNLQSSAVLALGPLSGVGARINSLGAIAARSNFKMAALAGTVVGLSVGMVALAAQAVKVTREFDKAEVRFKQFTGSAEAARKEIAFVVQESRKVGINAGEVVKPYAKMAAAAHRAGVSLEDTRAIMRGVSDATAAMRLETSDTVRIYKALEQMLSKGNVRAEELNQQLGDSLVGAIGLMAETLKVGTGELVRMMEEGLVPADTTVVAFGKHLSTVFGKAAQENITTMAGATNNIASAWQQFALRFDQVFGVSEKTVQSLLNFDKVLVTLHKNMLSITRAIGSLSIALGALAIIIWRAKIAAFVKLLLIKAKAARVAALAFIDLSKALGTFNASLVAITSGAVGKFLKLLVQIVVVIGTYIAAWWAIGKVTEDTEESLADLNTELEQTQKEMKATEDAINGLTGAGKGLKDEIQEMLDSIRDWNAAAKTFRQGLGGGTFEQHLDRQKFRRQLRGLDKPTIGALTEYIGGKNYMRTPRSTITPPTIQGNIQALEKNTEALKNNTKRRYGTVVDTLGPYKAPTFKPQLKSTSSATTGSSFLSTLGNLMLRIPQLVLGQPAYAAEMPIEHQQFTGGKGHGARQGWHAPKLAPWQLTQDEFQRRYEDARNEMRIREEATRAASDYGEAMDGIAAKTKEYNMQLDYERRGLKDLYGIVGPLTTEIESWIASHEKANKLEPLLPEYKGTTLQQIRDVITAAKDIDSVISGMQGLLTGTAEGTQAHGVVQYMLSAAQLGKLGMRGDTAKEDPIGRLMRSWRNQQEDMLRQQEAARRGPHAVQIEQGVISAMVNMTRALEEMKLDPDSPQYLQAQQLIANFVRIAKQGIDETNKRDADTAWDTWRDSNNASIADTNARIAALQGGPGTLREYEYQQARTQFMQDIPTVGRPAGFDAEAAADQYIQNLRRLDDAEEQYQRIETLTNDISNNMAAIVTGTKKFGDALRDVAQTLLRMTLTRIAHKLAEPIANKAVPFLTQLLGNLIPGKAKGDQFMVGGAGGTDSQLVMFRATPNERVTVETPQQQLSDHFGLMSRAGNNSGGSVIQITNNNDFSNSGGDVEMIAEYIEQRDAATVAQIQDMLSRGRIGYGRGGR